jgi:hypothetical protein
LGLASVADESSFAKRLDSIDQTGPIDRTGFEPFDLGLGAKPRPLAARVLPCSKDHA